MNVGPTAGLMSGLGCVYLRLWLHGVVGSVWGPILDCISRRLCCLGSFRRSDYAATYSSETNPCSWMRLMGCLHDPANFQQMYSKYTC